MSTETTHPHPHKMNGAHDAAQEAEGLKDAARAKVDDLAEQANEAWAKGEEQVRDAWAKGEQQVRTLGHSVEHSVRQNPLMALGAAFGIGAVAALLLTRKD